MCSIHKKIYGVWGGIFLAMTLVSSSGCSGKKETPVMPPRPVQTAVAVQKDVPYYIEAFGNLTPLMNVDIKSQVTGKILEADFTEGQRVALGDLLFSIDPAEYQAELEKSQAALKVDTVDLKMKKDTLERNRPLVGKELVSLQDFEKYQTDVDSEEAQITLDEANVALAQINLNYCSIKSPVNGIIGKRLVDPGNIVLANNGPALANIKTIDTLYVDFTVTDRQLADIRKAMATGILKVEVRVPDEGAKVYSGKLKLIENSVDNTTGTISLRAIVPNEGNALWAGQFVYARLILGIEKNAVLIPYAASQMGQKGTFAFVVMPGNKVDLRILQTGSRQDDDIVVEKGIAAGEKVVTVGQMGLSHGASVLEIPANGEKKPV
ncbi:MAG: efflux RND transporter periplasmic adaptor subunit [Candidatus Omnitrophica bacterium]|nr:efflux RND transporter periplasmic adaptor subunit [Candidatus Omnitrophota bacterium]